MKNWFEDFVQRQGLIASVSDDITRHTNMPEEEEDADDGESLSQLCTSWYMGDTCHDAFKKLSPVQRRLLVLKYLDNLSDKKIAAQLYISIPEAQSMISEAEEIVRRYKTSWRHE